MKERDVMENRKNKPGVENPNEPLNRKQIHTLVTRRLNDYRPAAWEDDFSRNSLDDLPFENLRPISERLEEVRKLNAPCLDRTDVSEFARRDSMPIPSPDDRERYSVGFDAMYWFTGLCDYLKAMSEAAKNGVTVDRVLDFGCASGRVLRHFVTQSEIPEIWGSDINARHIRWLCEFMPPKVKPIANHCIPQLPIADRTFDLITAFSVFTHIDTFETCWLAELKRILKVGGLAYVTIHNEDTWASLRTEIDNTNNRLVQAMIGIDPDIQTKLSGDMPDGRTVYRFTERGPYRAHVFHSHSYIRNVWGRFFEIVDILPCHHARQSVVVLKNLNRI